MHPLNLIDSGNDLWAGLNYKDLICILDFKEGWYY
jgi:hypothetical protein